MRYEVGHRKKKEIIGTERKLLGGCPLTTMETSLLLRELGFPSHTRIYFVAGEAYIWRRKYEISRGRFPQHYHEDSKVAVQFVFDAMWVCCCFV
jgi:hypothetical protein